MAGAAADLLCIPAVLPAILPLAPHGYRLLAGGKFASTGLEGFRPAFLYIGANELPRQSDGGELEKSSRGGWHNLL